MFNSEICFVDEKIIEDNIVRLETAFNRYVENYTEEQLNQIYKSKENNIYLFLDDTFNNSELRFARNCFFDKNPESFFANYEERTIKEKIMNYKYKITTTNTYKYYIVQIIDIKFQEWDPSCIFIETIAQMKVKKDNVLFEKLVSPIYKEYFPFDDPIKIQNINENTHKYLQEILLKKEYDLNAALVDIHRRMMRSYDYVPSSFKEYEIKKMRETILSCKYKLDFKNELTEEEILVLNKLMDSNKYNLFLNKRYKTSLGL